MARGQLILQAIFPNRLVALVRRYNALADAFVASFAKETLIYR